MNRLILPILAFALIPTRAHAQTAEVSGSVQIGAVAPAQQPVNAQSQPVAQPQPVYVQQPVNGPPPQPMYVQPYGYGARTRVVPYAGGPIPPGAQLRPQSNRGLLVGGGIVFGVTYGISLIAGALCIDFRCPNGWTLLVPIVGPVVAGASAYGASVATEIMLGVFDGVAQAAGLTMLIIGAVSHRQELVMSAEHRPRRPSGLQWALIPSAPGAHLGLSLGITNF